MGFLLATAVAKHAGALAIRVRVARVVVFVVHQRSRELAQVPVMVSKVTMSKFAPRQEESMGHTWLASQPLPLFNSIQS